MIRGIKEYRLEGEQNESDWSNDDDRPIVDRNDHEYKRCRKIHEMISISKI